ncbi:MAG: hypothetical protein RL434_1555, partial [Pseudomonadota bacterium]
MKKLVSALTLLCAMHTAHAGPRVFVTNEFADSVSVIDATTHNVTATVAVGKRP